MTVALVYICEICQTPLEELAHCKYGCPNCGRTLDCSDVPILPASAKYLVEDGCLVRRPGADPDELLPEIVTGEEAQALLECAGHPEVAQPV